TSAASTSSAAAPAPAQTLLAVMKSEQALTRLSRRRFCLQEAMWQKDNHRKMDNILKLFVKCNA
ncbi:MAG: hypothetical protein IKU71_01270, partial [Kiritimatiellae bacterium]|nr:hypothetical protein [Kiritimatiellia bacterium]